MSSGPGRRAQRVRRVPPLPRPREGAPGRGPHRARVRHGAAARGRSGRPEALALSRGPQGLPAYLPSVGLRHPFRSFRGPPNRGRRLKRSRCPSRPPRVAPAAVLHVVATAAAGLRTVAPLWPRRPLGRAPGGRIDVTRRPGHVATPRPVTEPPTRAAPRRARPCPRHDPWGEVRKGAKPSLSVYRSGARMNLKYGSRMPWMRI
jgi:hypothetical protein